MKTKPANNNYLFWLVGALLVVIIAIAAYIVFLLVQPVPSTDVPDYLLDDDGITVLEPPMAIPVFELTDQHNNPVALDDFYGRPMLITFGYTHCPDVCPITLGEFRNIRHDLVEYRDSIHYLFITVDGERDTPEVLATYFTTLQVADFIIGMTGTENEISMARQVFGVESILHEPDDIGNYNVDHTAGMFLLDEDGYWIRRYRYGTRSNIIAEDILEVLNT